MRKAPLPRRPTAVGAALRAVSSAARACVRYVLICGDGSAYTYDTALLRLASVGYDLYSSDRRVHITNKWVQTGWEESNDLTSLDDLEVCDTSRSALPLLPRLSHPHTCVPPLSLLSHSASPPTGLRTPTCCHPPSYHSYKTSPTQSCRYSPPDCEPRQQRPPRQQQPRHQPPPRHRPV